MRRLIGIDGEDDETPESRIGADSQERDQDQHISWLAGTAGHRQVIGAKKTRDTRNDESPPSIESSQTILPSLSYFGRIAQIHSSETHCSHHSSEDCYSQRDSPTRYRDLHTFQMKMRVLQRDDSHSVSSSCSKIDFPIRR
jgi:hypothetical protein